jgi:hypothetical protein
MLWKSDPEAQYRAGFEEGAWALFRQIEPRLLPGARDEVRSWLGKKLDPWRLQSRQEVARGAKPGIVLPPTFKLSSN